MWKKLALLLALAGAVVKAVRYWNHAGARAAARGKRDVRADVQRWEDEGGNLKPAGDSAGASAAGPASKSPRVRRTRAGTGTAGRTTRGSAAASS